MIEALFRKEEKESERKRKTEKLNKLLTVSVEIMFLFVSA